MLSNEQVCHSVYINKIILFEKLSRGLNSSLRRVWSQRSPAASLVTFNVRRARCARLVLAPRIAWRSLVYVARAEDDHAFVCQCCYRFERASGVACVIVAGKQRRVYFGLGPRSFMYGANMREREEFSRCFLPGQPAQVALPLPPLPPPPPPSPRAPGLDALHSLCKQIYPDQGNPLTVTAVIKYW